VLRKKLIAIAFVAAVSAAWPAAAADHHGGGHAVVFAGGYYYHPYFYDPWFGPWGPWYPPYAYGYYPQFFAPPEADLRILVKPNTAEVYVDGYFAGTVNEFDGVFQRLHVPPGQHEITLHLQGYRTVHQKLYLPANTTYKLRYTMEPLAAGETAEPPPNPPAPPPGQPGPPPMAQPMAPPGRPQLPPPQEPSQGLSVAPGATLSIRVQPAGAEITIDGERWQGPEGEERLLVQVGEGMHHVEIHKDGYRRFATDIQARRGETVPLNVALTAERAR
jgi:hypothetical protein